MMGGNWTDINVLAVVSTTYDGSQIAVSCRLLDFLLTSSQPSKSLNFNQVSTIASEVIILYNSYLILLVTIRSIVKALLLHP